MQLKRYLPLFVLLAAACGGSSTQPSNSGSGSGSGAGSGSAAFSATIDGVAFNATSVTVTLSSTKPPYLGLSAADAGLNLFSFAMGPASGSFGVGTYEVGTGDKLGNNGNFVLPGGSTIWTAVGNRGSGQVTITAFSTATKTVSGTFNFVLVSGNGSTKTVTNGSFNTTYTP